MKEGSRTMTEIGTVSALPPVGPQLACPGDRVGRGTWPMRSVAVSRDPAFDRARVPVRHCVDDPSRNHHDHRRAEDEPPSTGPHGRNQPIRCPALVGARLMRWSVADPATSPAGEEQQVDDRVRDRADHQIDREPRLPAPAPVTGALLCHLAPPRVWERWLRHGYYDRAPRPAHVTFVTRVTQVDETGCSGRGRRGLWTAL